MQNKNTQALGWLKYNHTAFWSIALGFELNSISLQCSSTVRMRKTSPLRKTRDEFQGTKQLHCAEESDLHLQLHLQRNESAADDVGECPSHFGCRRLVLFWFKSKMSRRRERSWACLQSGCPGKGPRICRCTCRRGRLWEGRKVSVKGTFCAAGQKKIVISTVQGRMLRGRLACPHVHVASFRYGMMHQGCTLFCIARRG